jgi:diguanylate cyclase (GGDEF)-like protein/PAS domain S-box-containing protein
VALGPDPDDPRVLAALLAHASEFLLFVDRRAGVVAAAGAGLGPAGFSAGGPGTGRHIAERIHPDDIARVLEIIELARADAGFRGTVRARALGEDDRWRTFQSEVIGVADHPVLGTGAVVRSRLVSTTERSETGRFASLASAIPLGVLTGDIRGWVVFANERAREILGLVDDDVLGERWRDAVHPDDLPDALDAGRLVVLRGGVQHAVVRVLDGSSTRWVAITVSPLGTPRRRTGWVATLEDVTDRERRTAAMAHQATHDALTGLPDRGLLEDRLAQADARRRDGLAAVSVLFVDLDDFKGVNDRLGHRVGDEVLRAVARRLLSTVRPTDTVARLGGDEFVVVLEGADEQAASALARRVREEVAQPLALEVDPSVHQVVVGASVGWATAREGESATDLLARADRAMYEHKGRRG